MWLRWISLSSAALLLQACALPTTTETIPLPFQALGNEPGWSVVINPDHQATITLDYGEQQLDLLLPPAQVTYAGTHYRAEYQDQPFALDIIFNTCSDTMSDTSYPYETRLEILGKQYQGCGRPAP